MSSVAKRWLVVGAIASVGLVIAVIVMVNSKDIREYIEDTYQRDISRDEDAAQAYTSDKSPAQVSQQIRDEVTALDELHINGRYYLQYEDDIVVISSLLAGTSLILLDDYDAGYARHRHIVGSYWSSTRPSYRGGGSGSGK